MNTVTVFLRDNKLFVLTEVPEYPPDNADSRDHVFFADQYRSALQSAKDSAIEVLNQKQVANWLINEHWPKHRQKSSRHPLYT